MSIGENSTGIAWDGRVAMPKKNRNQYIRIYKIYIYSIYLDLFGSSGG